MLPAWFILITLLGGTIQWTDLPPLPPAPGRAVQPGLAGAFAGVHEGALLVAGGANFPDGAPWRGGRKVFWDDIFVLEKTAGESYRWIIDPSFKLPKPLAYGVSISTVEGVLCMGGCDGTRCSEDVFLLRWNPKTKEIDIQSRPPLPRPLAFMAGARVGSQVYLAGGQESMEASRASNSFLRLDLSSLEWESLPPWPGPERILPVCAAQSDGLKDCLYLFSGRNVAPGMPTQILADSFRYDPSSREWRRLADVRIEEEEPRCVMAAAAVASGAHHILVFGGADGTLLKRIEALDEREKAGFLDRHPGFSRDILAFHTVTGTWFKAGELPAPAPVTTTAVRWDSSFVIASGETRPGVRTPAVLKGKPPAAGFFGWINYSVLGLYLAVLVGMGVYFSRREKSTDDFFKASGRVPWWAAGLSIFGTQLSAITFMAIPAKTYATDWLYLTGNMTIIMVAPFIILLFLPFFRRLNVTSAYEYLERRFNPAARIIGSLMFISLQLSRIGIVLFLPSIALSVVTGMDVTLCILLMGILSITYTVLGGIEAVIWTDVMQVIVLLLGALLSLVVILLDMEDGAAGLMSLALAEGKFRAFDFTFDLATPTFWVVLIGGVSSNLISYGSDQSVIQRYLTTKDEKTAARGIWTNGLLCVPASFLFFFIGTALFAYYKTHPESTAPFLDNGDAVFPWFIVSRLPPGLAGLLIAAVFAASMSSLDSSMNSVSAAVTTDFFRRFKPGVSDRVCLNAARWVTVVVGAAGTALALMMAGWGIKSMWDQLMTYIGLFAGGLGGLFLLGIFSRRAHGAGAVVGLATSGVVQYLVKELTGTHFLLYTFTGIASCLAAGYAASLLIPSQKRKNAGLTLSSLDPKNA